MRKFVLVTKDFSGLGFALLNKSDKVIIAKNPDKEKFEDKPEEKEMFDNIGKGLVKSFDLADIMKNREKFREWYFVFDGNHSVEENELLREEGFKVGLGGELPFKMENDREFGIELAEKYDIESPLWDEFDDAESGIKFIDEYPENMYFYKPNAADESHFTTPPIGDDVKVANEILKEMLLEIESKEGFILQKKVIGTEVNLEYFCVDGEVKSAQINLEVKRISEASLIDGYEKGSLCGCAFDVCRNIELDNKLVEMTIGKFLPFIKENNYTGFADMNFILEGDKVWFVEWCWRTGYNAHPNYFMNISNKDYLNTIADMIDGTYELDVRSGWGASVTVYTDHPAKGIPIMPEVKDGYFLFDGMQGKKSIVQTGHESGSNEIVIVGGYGDSIAEALENAYENVTKLNIVKSDYRSDGLLTDYNSSPIKRYKDLKKEGLI
jgi:phosphoribosylamine-glycine ligase